MLPFPMLFYHATLVSNIPKILAQGIVPRKRPMCCGGFGQDIRRHKKAIFAFDCLLDAVRWAFKLDWDLNHRPPVGRKRPIAVIAFEPNNPDEWQPDQHWESMCAAGRWLFKIGAEAPLQATAVILEEEWLRLVKEMIAKERSG